MATKWFNQEEEVDVDGDPYTVEAVIPDWPEKHQGGLLTIESDASCIILDLDGIERLQEILQELKEKMVKALKKTDGYNGNP